MKLIFENWRNYLEEAKGDRETSAIAREVILRLKKVIDAAVKSGAADLQEFSLTTPVPGFENRVTQFISILDIESLKKQQQQSQKSQILSHINKIVIVLEFVSSNTQEVKARSYGASWNPRDNILQIGPIKFGGILSKNKKSLYGWVEEFNIEVNDLIKHELEHAYQDEKSDDNIKDLLKSYSYEMGNLDTPQKIKFLMSRWGKRLLNGVISVFHSKPKTSSEDYREVINQYADELKMFRKITPDDAVDDELILYYFQDLEIEAYAAGFYRQARLKTKKDLKEVPDYRESDPEFPRKQIKAHFDDIVGNYSNVLRDIGRISDQAAVKKVLDAWEVKVKEYAQKRFPLLSDKDLTRNKENRKNA